MRRKNQAERPKKGGACSENYAAAGYWEQRYNSSSGFHAWYYSFEDLKPLFERTLGGDEEALYSCSVLEIGCGDSPLIGGFSRAKAQAQSQPQSQPQPQPQLLRLHGVDIAANIVEHLTAKQPRHTKHELLYSRMDATRLDFPDHTFDLVVDKGTIDALLCEPNAAVKTETVTQVFYESFRVLKRGQAALMVVSHMQPDSDEWREVVESCLLPAIERIDCVCRRSWAVESHAGKASVGRAAVHVVLAKERRVSGRLDRGGTKQPRYAANITMSVHEYSSDEDEDEDEDQVGDEDCDE